MKKLQFIFAAAALLVLSLGLTGCDPNNPNNPNMPAIVSTSETNNAYGIVVEVIYKNNTRMYFKLYSPTECHLTSYHSYYGSGGFSQYAYSGDLVIPESITHKGTTYTVVGIDYRYAFLYFTNEVTSVWIPKTIVNIMISSDYEPWGGDLCNAINVAVDNPYYASIDGVLFSKDKTMLIGYPKAKGGETYTIPDGVTTIDSQAFKGFLNFTSIIIPNSMTEISYNAFESCYNLTSIIIPNSVTKIGNWAFEYCENLNSITIPEGVVSIGSSAFSGCKSLNSMVLPSSVTDIGWSAFSGCTNLTTITCLAIVPPVAVTSTNYAFYESSIRTVKVPAGSVEAYRAADGWRHLDIVAL